MNKDNTWLNDKNIKHIEFYVKAADAILVERNRTIKIVLDLFRYHFNEPKNLCLLDVGCGDGILTKNIFERYPDNNFKLLDGAITMIEKARENLQGNNFSFIHQDFEGLVESEDKIEYDFIYSANAIHHLDINGKTKLYTSFYNQMKPDGLFINIDVVLPASERSEKWQFNMWVDWINETLYKNNFKDEIGKYDDLPSRYKNAAENQPSPLFDQLKILKDIGFKDVDCFYKYGLFSIFGGVK